MPPKDHRNPPSLEEGAGSAEMVVLVAALGFPTLAAWLYFLVLPPGPGLVVAYFLAKLAQFSLPLAWAGWVRGEPLRGLVPGRSGSRAGLASGAVLGAVVLLGYVAILRGGELAQAAAPRIRARLEVFSADGLAGYLLLALALAVVHSYLEEYYWRWFVYGRLRRRMATGPAVLVASVGFAGHHVVVLAALGGPAAATVTGGAMAVAAAGAIWAWQYERSGGLTAPWVSHILVDLAILAAGWDILGKG